MTAAKGTYAFVSLGCPKNLVDSERMLGRLTQDGYALTPDAEGADVVIINTCGFIEPARQESLSVIREMLALTDTTPRFYTWDITAYVKAELAAGHKTITLVLQNASSSDPFAHMLACRLWFPDRFE